MADQTDGNADVLVTTALGNHWCDMLLLVPSEDRGRAVELMSQMCAEYGKELLRAESRGYCDGKQNVADDERRQGYDDGWRAAIAEIMGRCNSPERSTAGPLSTAIRLPS
jgi:hypothetical protein